METKTKQSGRKQAMTNTFNRLMTQPMEYTPLVNKAYCHIENCELCGAALEYSFKLQHFDDPNFTEGKSLYVGSDCIVNFAETYVPSMAKQLLLSIEKSVETARIGKFRKNNPTINEDMININQLLNAYCKEFGYAFFRLNEVDNFKTSLKKLNRTEYLTAPQVEKFYSFKSKVDSGKLVDLLKNHQENIKNQQEKIKNNELLAEDDKKFIKFVEKHRQNVYFYSGYPYNLVKDLESKNQIPKFSNLEKQLYKEKVNENLEKKKKLEKRKEKALKQLNQVLVA